jgi:acyl-CoA synthetase (AMP-forming)/AMP-acid ligase II
VVLLPEGENIEPQHILEYCRNQLSAVEVPDRLEVVAALPHTAKGALDRRAVEVQFVR